MSDVEKNIDQAIAPKVETDVGTAADVDEIMKKYDRESNVRIWTGMPKQILRFSLAAFMLFMVWMNTGQDGAVRSAAACSSAWSFCSPSSSSPQRREM